VDVVLAEVCDLVDRLYELEAHGIDLLWRLCADLPMTPNKERAQLIRTFLSGDDDLAHVPLSPDGTGSAVAEAVFLSSMVDQQVVNESLVGGFGAGRPAGNVAAWKTVSTYRDAVLAVLSGRVLVFLADVPGALALEAHGYKLRGIEPPVLQTVARGPQEGFVEDLAVNVSLVRRRLLDPRLVFEPLRVGALGRTEVRLAYVRGLANGRIVAEARRRLRTMSATVVLDTNFIEEAIQDDPYSPFPQLLFSERPDVVAASLAEGRFAILVDGTSNALIAPVTFWSFLQAPDDYYQRYPSATFLRVLRQALHLVAMLMPALYIALTTFHQQMIPTYLLMTIIRSRQGIPFPAVIEAFIMELSFEVMREAGLRLPQKLGTSLSVVGGLILGQAAIFAGLVSWPMVVIVAITAITNFAIPQWEMALAIRLIRFAEMVAAAVFGVPGIMVLNVGILMHVTSLRSFGVPYFYPAAPLDFSGIQDVVVRRPHWSPHPRPYILAPGWRRQGRPGRRPRPPRHSGTQGFDPR
jgi:spore germination protein KA